MIGYVTFGTSDLARAAKFYDAIAKEMGTGRMMEEDTFIAWGKPGGGAGIAGVCDMRIASRDLKFGFPISRTLGNTLSADTLSRMVNLIGEAKVIDLIFTSRLIEADEALQIGLVNELQDDCDAVMDRAWALASRLKQHAPLTMR